MGIPVQIPVGIPVGIPVRITVGIPVGIPVRIPVRITVGIPAGILVGIPAAARPQTARRSQINKGSQRGAAGEGQGVPRQRRWQRSGGQLAALSTLNYAFRSGSKESPRFLQLAAVRISLVATAAAARA